MSGSKVKESAENHDSFTGRERTDSRPRRFRKPPPPPPPPPPPLEPNSEPLYNIYSVRSFESCYLTAVCK